ncbi:MAG: hypothetical protein K2L51_06660, partial [Clostridiales bacterium]|nr:hypothetical protein [Clostridiales bacterium]
MNKERTVAKNGRKHLVGVCVLLLLIASLLWATARPAPVRADDFGECVQTYTLEASGQATEWNNAVEHAQRLGNDTSYIKVRMDDNWALEGNESGAGFNDGRLYIPSDAKISLDLNGCVLSRSLANAKANGSVLYVKGALQIEDSKPTKENTVKDDTLHGGVITGGNTTGDGGAIVVAKYQEGDAKNK